MTREEYDVRQNVESFLADLPLKEAVKWLGVYKTCVATSVSRTAKRDRWMLSAAREFVANKYKQLVKEKVGKSKRN